MLEFEVGDAAGANCGGAGKSAAESMASHEALVNQWTLLALTASLSRDAELLAGHKARPRPPPLARALARRFLGGVDEAALFTGNACDPSRLSLDALGNLLMCSVGASGSTVEGEGMRTALRFKPTLWHQRMRADVAAPPSSPGAPTDGWLRSRAVGSGGRERVGGSGASTPRSVLLVMAGVPELASTISAELLALECVARVWNVPDLETAATMHGAGLDMDDFDTLLL